MKKYIAIVLVTFLVGCNTTQKKLVWNPPPKGPVSIGPSEIHEQQLRIQDAVFQYKLGHYQEALRRLRSISLSRLTRVDKQQVVAYGLACQYLLGKSNDPEGWLISARKWTPDLNESPVIREFPPKIREYISQFMKGNDYVRNPRRLY